MDFEIRFCTSLIEIHVRARSKRDFFFTLEPPSRRARGIVKEGLALSIKV